MSKRTKRMKIFMLYDPPHYYASDAYRECEKNGKRFILITGTKYDVTEDVERIKKQAIKDYQRRIGVVP